MGYNRENINGTTPQDLNKLNENFMAMWQKVFGDIDFSDTNNKLKEKICTQWIPVQGEGNLDGRYPMTVRFFIPPNTKKIKSSNFSFIAENYRMDSDVALGGGGITEAPIVLTVNSGKTLININERAISSTVKSWRTCDNKYFIDLPSASTNPDDSFFAFYVPGVSSDSEFLNSIRDNFKFYKTNGPYHLSNSFVGSRFVPCIKGNQNVNDTYKLHGYFLDIGHLDHVHDITHLHTITDGGHGHTGSAMVNLDPHGHDLNAGIKVVTTIPDNVLISVNDIDVAIVGSSTSLIKNDVDISKHLKIGQWNTIKASAGMVARIVMYGTIEVVTNYF